MNSCVMPSETASSSPSRDRRRKFTASTESAVLPTGETVCYTCNMLSRTSFVPRDRTKGDALIASIHDISDRLGREAILTTGMNAPLGFQRLVADAAGRLSAVGGDTVNEAIVECLHDVGEALQADCAVLWHKAAGASATVVSHAWGHPSCGWTAAGSTIFAIAASDDDLAEQCGFRSAKTAPMPPAADGSVSALMFASMHEHTWTPAAVESARLIAGIVSQTLARQVSQEA